MLPSVLCAWLRLDLGMRAPCVDLEVSTGILQACTAI